MHFFALWAAYPSVATCIEGTGRASGADRCAASRRGRNADTHGKGAPPQAKAPLGSANYLCRLANLFRCPILWWAAVVAFPLDSLHYLVRPVHLSNPKHCPLSNLFVESSCCFLRTYGQAGRAGYRTVG